MSDRMYCMICNKLMIPSKEQICSECKEALRLAGYVKAVRCKDCKYYDAIKRNGDDEMDREKVISALEFCTDTKPVETCFGKCPYAVADDDYRCRDMKLDALALLKEQEAKTGHWVEQQINSYTRSTTCSVCGGSAPFVFVSADRYGRNGCGKDELTKYCPNCGAEMKGET